MSFPTAKKITDFLDLDLCGDDIVIRFVRSLDSLEDGSLVFAARVSEETVARLESHPAAFALVAPEFEGRIASPHAIAPNPRLMFARAVQEFFCGRPASHVASTACIGAETSVGDDVSIGEYTVIGNQVTLADHVTIGHHVVIADGTIIGADSVIRSHSVIGEGGFGFEYDDEGRPVRLPHVGHVRIGERVEIGAFNSIARGTIDDTIIDDDVKTDDHVHIAHNVRVGCATLITACAEISGSSKIGQHVWIGPNASIIDKISLANNAFIGIGCVVAKDVPAGAVMGAVPGRRIRTESADR